MAQPTGIIRKIKGAVGDLTFKQVNGITIVSEKVTDVKNPRTEAQMRQRTKWPPPPLIGRGNSYL